MSTQLEERFVATQGEVAQTSTDTRRNPGHKELTMQFRVCACVANSSLTHPKTPPSCYQGRDRC